MKNKLLLAGDGEEEVESFFELEYSLILLSTTGTVIAGLWERAQQINSPLF